MANYYDKEFKYKLLFSNLLIGSGLLLYLFVLISILLFNISISNLLTIIPFYIVYLIGFLYLGMLHKKSYIQFFGKEITIHRGFLMAPHIINYQNVANVKFIENKIIFILKNNNEKVSINLKLLNKKDTRALVTLLESMNFYDFS